MSGSVLGELPEDVASAMFLRDGWPDAVVCKVQMKTGCIGIGIYRPHHGHFPISPQFADQAALIDAMSHVSAEPPDYSELHEHVAKQKAQATAQREEPEADEDLQAALGQKANG